MPEEARRARGGRGMRRDSRVAADDRRSIVLFASLVLLLVMNPLLENNRTGRGILVGILFFTLVASALELSGQKERWQWPVLLLLASSMVVTTVAYLSPGRTILILSWGLTAAFFGLVSSILFLHLGQPGVVNTGRLVVSASLYLLLAMFWFAVYTMLEIAQPGSFVQLGSAPGILPRSALMYLSLVTQTTLGYGDVLPTTSIARMLAALQSTAGVFYVAITVARLVSAYERGNRAEGRGKSSVP